MAPPSSPKLRLAAATSPLFHNVEDKQHAFLSSLFRRNGEVASTVALAKADDGGASGVACHPSVIAARNACHVHLPRQFRISASSSLGNCEFEPRRSQNQVVRQQQILCAQTDAAPPRWLRHIETLCRVLWPIFRENHIMPMQHQCRHGQACNKGDRYGRLALDQRRQPAHQHRFLLPTQCAHHTLWRESYRLSA